MFISFTQNKRIECDLPDSVVLEVTKTRLLKSVHPGTFLSHKWDPINGKSEKLWLACDDPDWRHGSISTEYLHEATEFEKAVFLVLDTLNGTNNKNRKNI